MASTVGSIRRPILTVSAVGAPVRLSIMSSLAVTRLTYNVHVLAPLHASQVLTLHAEHTRAVRIVWGNRGSKPRSTRDINDRDLLTTTKTLFVGTLILKARLLHLARLSCGAPAPL
eukprot:12604622-Alexandrium_andersonii.AAC.1